VIALEARVAPARLGESLELSQWA